MKKHLPILFIMMITGFSIALTLFQLMPGNNLSPKKALLLIAGFLIGALLSAGIYCLLKKICIIPKKTIVLFFVLSICISPVLTGLFHLSLPQKEILLKSRNISIKILDASFGSGDVGIRFLSLNNGYRGISFSDFLQSGSWQRQDDELFLRDMNEQATLFFQGKTGRIAELFFLSGKKAGVVEIDWGDGITEVVDLNAKLDAPVSKRIVHDFGISTENYEKANFFFNLLSVVIPLFLFLWLIQLILWIFVHTRSKKFKLLFTVLTVFTIFYRVISVYHFPLGWDEGTYSRAAMRYSEKILSFKALEIPTILYNHEHPAFVKLTFAIPASMDGRAYYARFGWNNINNANLGKEDYTIFTGRMVSAVFSIWLIQAVCLLIHPLAAFFLIIDSLAAEYGAQARLEALPMLFSFLSIWFFNQFIDLIKKEQRKKSLKSLAFSSLFLGITAACKIIYCVIAFPMLIITIETFFQKKTRWRFLALSMICMAFCSLASFYVFNPSLWYTPVERIKMMLSFHEQYQTKAGDIYPFWQPLAWVTRSVAHQSGRYFEKSPLAKAPQNFLFSCDELIFLLACIGAKDLFKKQRIYIYWFLFGMIFMFLWGTKWEQYACIVVVPICIAAYYGCIRAARWLIPR